MQNIVDINADMISASTWLSASNTSIWTGINSGVVCENKESAKELHKPVIEKFEKRKVHSPFIDNVWGAALAVRWLFLFYYVLLNFLVNMFGLFL